MIMEEQLVMALVSPQTTVQVCLHKCLHYWGRDGLDPSSLDCLKEAQELGEEAKLQVYLGAS